MILTDGQIQETYRRGDILIEPFDEKQVQAAYHIKLLIKAGFVEGEVAIGAPMHIVSSLSWQGHEFLDNIRDQGIWTKTKQRLSGLSSVGLHVVAEIATAEIRKHLGL